MKFPKIVSLIIFFSLIASCLPVLYGCVGTPPEKEPLWVAGVMTTIPKGPYGGIANTDEVNEQLKTYFSKYLPASEKDFVGKLRNEGMFCSSSTPNEREHACTYSVSHHPTPCNYAIRLSLTVYFPVKPMFVKSKNGGFGAVSPNPEPDVVIKDIKVASAVTIDLENHEPRGVLFCK